MSDAADIASLLETARDQLREELMPVLEGEQRFTAAMIANAMAIAARALTLGDGAAATEAAALHRLYPEAKAASLEELRERFVDDLEAGRLDGTADRSVRAILRARIEARLQISNPAYRG